MTPKLLEYPLNDGFIDNWLILGPLAAPVVGATAQTRFTAEERIDIARKFFDTSPKVENEPIEKGYGFLPGRENSWKYFRCQEDHLVDISADYPNWQHASIFAYAELRLSQGTRLQVKLETTTAVDVWVNDQAVYHTDLCGDDLQSYQFDLELAEHNKFLVRARQIGSQSCVMLLRMQLQTVDPNNLSKALICLPTRANQPNRFKVLEENLESAYLDDVVNHKGKSVMLRWAEGTENFHYQYQVQDEKERIYVEGTWEPETAGTDIGHPFRLFERPFRVVIKAPAREYYELNNRYQRELPLYVLDTQYNTLPSGRYSTRRVQALKDAAKHDTTLFGQIALIATNKMDQIQPDVFNSALSSIENKDYGSELLLLGLLGLNARGLPETINSLGESIRSAAKNFTAETSVLDGQNSEGEQITRLACHVLAGQLLGDEALKRVAVPEAVAWMQAKGKSGFQAWLSNSESETIIAALAHLTSLAEDTTVRELAAVLLDKMLFEMAAHQFKGAYAATHGATEAGMLKSAQLEATSGICRLVYGMGVFNPNISGVVSLALSDYAFPTYFKEIAADQREEMLSRENHAGTTTVTYRTPDGMLSSAQDYKPGEKGRNEVVWQACLGPDTLIFGSHPAGMSEAPARRPGFWLGNAVLPRVAQWKDALVAVYNFSNSGMGFTHAHFPTGQFDEYVLQDGWAFARKGDGYLALTAARGLELIKRGQGAYRELRSYGSPNLWICQMGRKAVDESFEEFQAKILAMRLEWPENRVRFTSLRGEEIEFGWDGALKVNRQEVLLQCDKAIESPYCTAELSASILEISFGDTAMQLNFE